MHSVHFLTLATLNSKTGWVAPVELEQAQDGVLVVPVTDPGAMLFRHYDLECSIYQGSGKYLRQNVTLDLQPNGSLKTVIRGYSVKFVRHKSNGDAPSFNYIGKLLHKDFSLSLCEIDPEDEQSLDQLYDAHQLMAAGCDPEKEYGGIQALRSLGRFQ